MTVEDHRGKRERYRPPGSSSLLFWLLPWLGPDLAGPGERERGKGEWDRYFRFMRVMVSVCSVLAWLGLAWWATSTFGPGGLVRLLSHPDNSFAGLLKNYPLPLVAGGPADGVQLGPPGEVDPWLVHVGLPELLFAMCVGFAALCAWMLLSWAVRMIIGRVGAAS